MHLIGGDTYRQYYRVIITSALFYHLIRVHLVWLEGLKNEMIENGEGIENCEDRRDLIFFYICLIGRMENKVAINLQLYPY